MNIHVGNLAATTTDAELRAAFAAFGPVGSARVIFDRDTGRSRGFGFVEMQSDAAAKAIAALDGAELQGSRLRLTPARAPGQSQ